MELLQSISKYISGPIVVFLLLGTGLFLTLRLTFLQIRYFFLSVGLALGSTRIGSDLKSPRGDISSFQALTTALSATVGIGNIVGVAGAILLGGPGAVFWMWVTAFLGMATKYSEGVLAVKYREPTSNGFSGGPMYYIEKGLGLKWLGIFFAISTLVASIGIGNTIQSNAAAGEFVSKFPNIPRVIPSLFIALITGFVIIGGIKRIGKVTSFVVPFMAIFYMIGCGIIICLNLELVPSVFGMIFKYAFEPIPAITGTGIGFLQTSVMVGVQRGLFSNEAGLGSAPIADASAKTNYPVKQGLVSMLGPCIDTLMICTLTSLAILIGLESKGIEIIQKAISSKADLISKLTLPSQQLLGGGYSVWSMIVNDLGENAAYLKDVLVSSIFSAYLGQAGNYIITIGLLFFSVSTIIGWFYYSDRALVYLGLSKYSILYKLFWVSLTFWGAYGADIRFIWTFSEIANGLMVFPNLLALLLLSSNVRKTTKEFFEKFFDKSSLFSYLSITFLYKKIKK